VRIIIRRSKPYTSEEVSIILNMIGHCELTEIVHAVRDHNPDSSWRVQGAIRALIELIPGSMKHEVRK